MGVLGQRQDSVIEECGFEHSVGFQSNGHRDGSGDGCRDGLGKEGSDWWREGV